MASILDDLSYLEPSFDPNSLTVPQLRNVLVAHQVPFPSSAKKSQLIDTFNQHVAPLGPKLLKSQARTKRSARGIEDVPSSAASTTTDDVEDETVLPASNTRRTSRRTTRAATEESEKPVDTSVSKTRGKTPSRTAPSKHARALDAELEQQPAARRTRHSVTPAIKDEPEPEAWHRHEDVDSPFSSENPFQSGSSPAPAEQRPDRDRRRKTLGPVEHKEKRKSDAHRRRTVQPDAEQYEKDVVVPSRKTFEMPPARLRKKAPTEEPETVPAGEEFTPEEQLDLAKEAEQRGQVDVLPPRQRRQTSKAKGTLQAGVLSVLTVILAAFATVWRQEKLEVGYCGIGRESTSLAGVEIPEWASDLLPSCEPCPQHAYCYENMVTVCEKDFILKPHPLSLGGVVPLPPSCEPDSEKARRVTAVADKGVDALRERRAKWECGDLKDEEGKAIPTPEIKEADLKQEMSSKRRRGMSQDEFDRLWDSAIPEIIGRDEVVENTDGLSGQRTLTSTSLARIPLGCAARRYVRLSLERHLWKLSGLIFLILSVLYGRYSISYNRETEVRAKQLASYAFERLAAQASYNAHDPGRYPDLGISMTQLRDDILRDEFSASRRSKLWEKVQKKVEHNSNVRAAVREGRSGDVARMWEWIGPTQQLLEDGRSSGRRESGRISLGPIIGNSPSVLTPSAEQVHREMKELKNWDEGRPMY